MASTSLLINNTVKGSIFDFDRAGRNLRRAICSLDSYLCN
jgi:hypothetical protein